MRPLTSLLALAALALAPALAEPSAPTAPPSAGPELSPELQQAAGEIRAIALSMADILESDQSEADKVDALLALKPRIIAFGKAYGHLGEKTLTAAAQSHVPEEEQQRFESIGIPRQQRELRKAMDELEDLTAAYFGPPPSAEAELAAQGMLDLISDLNDMALSGKSGEELLAAFKELHPRAAKLGEAARGISHGELERAMNRLILEQEAKRRFPGYFRLREEATASPELLAALETVQDLAMGKSAPPPISPVVEDAVQSFMGLAEALNSIGLADKGIEATIADVRALRPLVEQVGEKVRRVGSSRVRDLVNERMRRAGAEEHYAGLLRLQQKADDNNELDEATREIVRLAEGRPAPPPPAPAAKVAADFMELLADIAALRECATAEKLADLQERLDACYTWLVKRDAPVAEVPALLAQEEGLIPLLKQLNVLKELEKDENLGDRAHMLALDLESVLEDFAPPAAKAALLVMEMREGFLGGLNEAIPTLAAKGLDHEDSIDTLLMLTISAQNYQNRALRDAGGEALLRPELNRLLQSDEGARLYPALRGEIAPPELEATVRALLDMACGHNRVADTPAQCEQALQWAREAGDFWRGVDAILHAEKMTAEQKRAALEALKPRATGLGKAVPAQGVQRFARAYQQLEHENLELEMLTRGINAGELADMVDVLYRLTLAEAPRLPKGTPRAAMAAHCADLLRHALEALQQPGLSELEQGDILENVLRQMASTLPPGAEFPDKRTAPPEAEQAAELDRLLRAYCDILRDKLRRGGDPALTAGMALIGCDSIRRLFGLGPASK